MRYEVKTWDIKEYCNNCYTVSDAVDKEEVKKIIVTKYPDEKILSITQIL